MELPSPRVAELSTSALGRIFTAMRSSLAGQLRHLGGKNRVFPLTIEVLGRP